MLLFKLRSVMVRSVQNSFQSASSPYQTTPAVIPTAMPVGG